MESALGSLVCLLLFCHGNSWNIHTILSVNSLGQPSFPCLNSSGAQWHTVTSHQLIITSPFLLFGSYVLCVTHIDVQQMEYFSEDVDDAHTLGRYTRLEHKGFLFLIDPHANKGYNSGGDYGINIRDLLVASSCGDNGTPKCEGAQCLTVQHVSTWRNTLLIFVEEFQQWVLRSRKLWHDCQLEGESVTVGDVKWEPLYCWQYEGLTAKSKPIKCHSVELGQPSQQHTLPTFQNCAELCLNTTGCNKFGWSENSHTCSLLGPNRWKCIATSTTTPSSTTSTTLPETDYHRLCEKPSRTDAATGGGGGGGGGGGLWRVHPSATADIKDKVITGAIRDLQNVFVLVTRHPSLPITLLYCFQDVLDDILLSKVVEIPTEVGDYIASIEKSTHVYFRDHNKYKRISLATIDSKCGGGLIEDAIIPETDIEVVHVDCDKPLTDLPTNVALTDNKIFFLLDHSRLAYLDLNVTTDSSSCPPVTIETTTPTSTLRSPPGPTATSPNPLPSSTNNHTVSPSPSVPKEIPNTPTPVNRVFLPPPSLTPFQWELIILIVLSSCLAVALAAVLVLFVYTSVKKKRALQHYHFEAAYRTDTESLQLQDDTSQKRMVSLSTSDVNRWKEQDTGTPTGVGITLQRIYSLYGSYVMWDAGTIIKGDKLGSGGFGTVYAGVVRHSNEVVALKEVETEHTTTTKELDALSQIDHPNIIRCYGIWRDTSDCIHLVLELCACGNMETFVKNNGPLPNDQFMYFATHIVSGLLHLHEKKFIHRDIKPSNLLIHRDGAIKLSDFGTAKQHSTLLSNSAARDVRTMATVAGTLLYMPPECMSGAATLKSDMWSLGLTFIFMLTGLQPYYDHQNQMPVHLLFMVASGKLSPKVPELNEKLTAIITRCLSFDPKERCSSQELLEMME